MNYADSYKKALGERLRFARGWTGAMRNTFRGGVENPEDLTSHGAFADAYQEHPDHLDQDPLPDLIRDRLQKSLADGAAPYGGWEKWADTHRSIDEAFGDEAPIGSHRGFRYYLSELNTPPGKPDVFALHVAPEEGLSHRNFTYLFEFSPDEMVKFLPKLDHLSPTQDFAGQEVHPSSFADRSPRQMLENIRDYLEAHRTAATSRWIAASQGEP